MSCKATRRIGYALDGVNFFVAAMQASFGVFVTVYLVRSHWAAQDIGFALAISTVASLCSHRCDPRQATPGSDRPPRYRRRLFPTDFRAPLEIDFRYQPFSCS